MAGRFQYALVYFPETEAEEGAVLYRRDSLDEVHHLAGRWNLEYVAGTGGLYRDKATGREYWLIVVKPWMSLQDVLLDAETIPEEESTKIRNFYLKVDREIHCGNTLIKIALICLPALFTFYLVSKGTLQFPPNGLGNTPPNKTIVR
jgi:hypothetical protein